MTDPEFPANSADESAHPTAVTTLEHETVAAMLSYQHHLAVAQLCFERMCLLSERHTKSSWRLASATANYRAAVKGLEMEENYLAELVARLGYVPKCDRKRFH